VHLLPLGAHAFHEALDLGLPLQRRLLAGQLHQQLPERASCMLSLAAGTHQAPAVVGDEQAKVGLGVRRGDELGVEAAVEEHHLAHLARARVQVAEEVLLEREPALVPWVQLLVQQAPDAHVVQAPAGPLGRHAFLGLGAQLLDEGHEADVQEVGLRGRALRRRGAKRATRTV